MALEYAHGAIQWLAADGATTVYTVSGLSFEPKALRFSWNGLQSATDAISSAVNLQRGGGFAISTSARRCVGSFSQDTAATSNCGTVARNDSLACTTDGAAASDGELDINSFTADGFTLIVDDACPANLTVFWEAWGGADISVAAVGDIAEPAATGDVDYSVPGFVAGATDQVVMLFGVQSTAALNTAASSDSGFMVGYATGAGAQNVVMIGNSDDASTAMDTDFYARGDECLGMITVAGGTAVDARAALTQFGTDNFRLNWAARAVTNRRYIFLAIKGGNWRVGDFTIDTTGLNTATVSGLPFAPKGLSAISGLRAENASNSAGTQDVMTWGCGNSTSSRRGIATRDQNATASSVCEIFAMLEYDEILGEVNSAGAIDALVDIDAMNSDGFRLIVDDAAASGSAVSWIGYLAFGDAPSAMAGTCSMSFGGTAVLSGAGALSGTAPVTFTPAATLRGDGALAGSTAMAFATAGVLGGSGALAGTSPVAFTTAGAMLGSGALAGTAPLIFTPAAVLEGSGALVGASPIVFSLAGELTAQGSGEMTGTASFAFSASAVLSGTGALSGTSSMTFTLTGQLTNLGGNEMTGVAAMSFATAGVLSGTGAMAGSAGMSFSPAATLRGDGALIGQADLVFVPSATLVGAGALAGVIPLSFSLTVSIAGGVELRITYGVLADPDSFSATADPQQFDAAVDSQSFKVLH